VVHAANGQYDDHEKGATTVKKLVLFVVPPLLLTTILAHGQSLDVESLCNLATPQSARVFDWAEWKTAKIADTPLVLEPLHWDASRTIFRGYEAAKPFDEPDDANKRWTISFAPSGNAPQAMYILQSRTTPDIDYVYVFLTATPSTDTNGNHYGLHPCRAFATDAAPINDWIQRAYKSH